MKEIEIESMDIKTNYVESIYVKKSAIKKNIPRMILIMLSVTFLVIMLGFPLCVIICEALKEGIGEYAKAMMDSAALSALKLTLSATVIATVLNTVFGVVMAWCITKFQFKGKNILLTFLDLPFAISPIIAGLVFILTFGRRGLFGDFLQAAHIRIIFAVPGIILATIFVTFPFVAREIIPLMQSQGTDEEEAAALLGAKGFTIFRRVTLPNIKWGLLYGIILCGARAMGEFGAVSVVSGHIRGKTNTLPLHIEILYNEYAYTAAFAVASVLVILAVIILILRGIVESKGGRG